MMPENRKRLTDNDDLKGCAHFAISAVMVMLIIGFTIGLIVFLLKLWLSPSGDEISGVLQSIVGIMMFSSIFWAMNFAEKRPDRNTDLNDWQIKVGDETYHFRGRELSSQFYSRKIFPNGLETEDLTIYKTEAGKYILLIKIGSNKEVITYDSPKDLINNLYGLADDSTIRALLMESVGRDPGFRNILSIINSEFPAQDSNTKKKEVINIE